MNNSSGPDPREVQQIADSLEEDLLALLDEMVAINSHSRNIEGVARVAAAADRAIPALLNRQTFPVGENSRLWIYSHHFPQAAPILMAGHLDTVFKAGDWDDKMVEQGPFLHGPGIADMKGGVVTAIGALRVLDRLDLLSEIPVTLVLNGDEEIGSVDSAPVLKELALTSRLGLVFECGSAEGAVVTSRRGVRRYRLEIIGEAGHAGFQMEEKKSALVELAHQILRLEALNKPKAGLTINVGVARGGTATNIVPEHAEAQLEVRFWEEAVGSSTAERILASLASPCISGLQLKLHRTHARPSMPRTREVVQLFKDAAAIAARLDKTLHEEARPGASDANIFAAVGLPSLDGLGPVGEMNHSPKERILRKSLIKQVVFAVHLLWGLRSWSPPPKKKRLTGALVKNPSGE